MHNLTFGGSSTTTIAANAESVSDPVALPVRAGTTLLVTTYVSAPAGLTTYHQDAQQVSFFTTSGDHSADVSGAAYTNQTQSWYYIDEVDVRSTGAPASVVALGDSITDGFQSTVSGNRRWPDDLARRLQQLPARQQLGVLNAGISANRVLLDGVGPSALSRVDRDAISRTGARTVLLLEGINDIDNAPPQPDATAIEEGLAQIAAQVRSAGLRVIGCTLTPDEGSGGYTAAREVERQQINTWIRTSDVYDGVVDFDAAVRDPADQHQILPKYDSGDHLHPNDTGYQAMANAIPLRVL
jgi:lysophospholipase L1-like esterase